MNGELGRTNYKNQTRTRDDKTMGSAETEGKRLKRKWFHESFLALPHFCVPWKIYSWQVGKLFNTYFFIEKKNTLTFLKSLII